ncbi:MAG: 1-(5-phosphoribosyl)-5-[(5-phosphoribosylamino)methylideneamino]imidazole-4-carboxamide isomerase [Alloprevotella sp.]
MIQIIPAVDLIDGRCVRLSQGDYARQTTYDADPADMVRRFADHGLQRIHVVDLDGAKASAPCNLRTLERMAAAAGAQIEWGGGLKSDEALRDTFNAGATWAVVGSLAARRPEVFAGWLDRFGPERMVLGADVREGKVSVSGWLEDLDLSIDDLVRRFLPHGLIQAICTDITRDGMLQGPSTELYTRLQEAFPAVSFCVSGGISSMHDIRRLNDLGLRRVIVGKALYEGRVTLAECEEFLVANSL